MPLSYKHSAISIQIIGHLYKNNFRFDTVVYYPSEIFKTISQILKTASSKNHVNK